MSNSIDTEITGKPGELRALALSLRSSTVPAIGSVGDDLVTARRESGDTWSSPAGEAFHAHTSELIDPVDQLEGYLGEAASALDALAGDLEQCQNLMEGICNDAASAGLTVNGFVIENPGPALPVPAPVPPDADATTAELHRQQSAAHDEQKAKIDAFTEAAGEASEVRNSETASAQSWGDTVTKKQHLRLAFTGAEFGVGGLAAGAIELRGQLHRDKARKLLDKSGELAGKRTTLTDFTSRQEISRQRSALHRQAYDHQKTFRSSNALSQKAAFRGSGILAVAGVAYDIAVLDKPWHQAAITGGVSFGASVAAGAATGALLGSFIPVPVVGTVVGAGVGTVVGIFTSGAVDSLFQSDGDGPSAAIDAGESALTDAWNTTSNATKSAWNALF